MRNYLILKERSAAFRADPEVQEALRASRLDELAQPTAADGLEGLLADRGAFEEFDVEAAARAAWPSSVSTSWPWTPAGRARLIAAESRLWATSARNAPESCDPRHESVSTAVRGSAMGPVRGDSGGMAIRHATRPPGDTPPADHGDSAAVRRGHGPVSAATVAHRDQGAPYGSPAGRWLRPTTGGGHGRRAPGRPAPAPATGTPGYPGPRRGVLFLAVAVIVALGIVAVVLLVNRGGGSPERKPPAGSSPSGSSAPSLGIPSGLPTELPSELPTELPSGLPTSLPTKLPSGFPSELPSSFPSDLESLFATPAS